VTTGPTSKSFLPRQRDIDFSNLVTSKLPDLEPKVAPDSYLNWRFLNPQGASNRKYERA